MYMKYLFLRNKTFIIFTYILFSLLSNQILVSIQPFRPQNTAYQLIDKNNNENSTNKQQNTIDIVYTWVNGSDPLWVSSFKKISKENKIRIRKKLFKMRFIDGEELRFSLRSIEKYAIHFIRYIFIIVANNSTQIPNWLNTSHPKIRIVTHHMIFGTSIPSEYKKDPNSIFNFNSVAIENCIINVPDLSNEFVYFNDDFFIGRPVQKSDFFDHKNRPKVIVNEHVYKKVNPLNEKVLKRAQNDFSYRKYAASLLYTLSVFEKKFKKLAPFDPFHVAYPTTKKVIKKCNELFEKEIKKTTQNAFRSIYDVKLQFITFQYGYLNDEVATVNVSDETAMFTSLYRQLNFNNLEKLAKIKPKLFGVNCENDVFLNRFKSLLFVWFSKPSAFELKTSKQPKIPIVEINYWKNKSIAKDL